MPVDSGENLDLYVVAQNQFDRALAWVDDLKGGMIDYLKAPNNLMPPVQEVGHLSMQISAAIGSKLGAIQHSWHKAVPKIADLWLF